MRKLILLVSMFLISEIAFSQWTTLTSGTTNYLTSVYFTDANTGYVVGDSGTILKTFNAGTKWSIISSGTKNYLGSVFFTNSDTGYVVGAGGIILRTIDAGKTWTLQSSGTDNNLVSVFFTDASTGYAVGDSGTILKTINAGATWTADSISITSPLTSIYFPTATTGYVVGLYGALVKTTNGGKNWTVINTGVTGLSLAFLSQYFFNADTGFISGGFIAGDGAIWKTTDGGATLTAVPVLTNYYLYSIFCPNADTGFASGEAGTVMKTLDGATVWDTLVSGTKNDLHGMFFTDPFTGYLVGALGTILKTSNGGGYNMGLNNLSSGSNSLVIYPNPSSGVVIIGTSSNPATGQLSILSIDGREILSQPITPPKTQVDITTLPPGLYIVRLISDGSVLERKLVKQ